MLTQQVSAQQLASLLVPRSQWTPFPPARQVDGWQGLLAQPLNRRRKEWLVGKAREVVGQPWPALPATFFMRFVRDGDRSQYEKPYFARRQRLSILTLAQCFEPADAVADEIINGLWAICEESTWVIPAHEHRDFHSSNHQILPDLSRPRVDLFAAETAMTLAEAVYLMEGSLGEAGQIAMARVREEILRRVIVPVETRGEEFWWMTSTGCNWTPWCCYNVLGAAMYVLDDPQRLANLAHRLMRAVDEFIGHYAPDGGCDEGPGYWNVAAGAMLVFLELLHSRTGGRIDIYGEPLIGEMGRYITKGHLTGRYFANFADAAARLALRRPVVYRYGERIGDGSMQELALLDLFGYDPRGQADDKLTGSAWTLAVALRELFWMPADRAAAQAQRPLHTWLGDLQVMIARQSACDTQGLILAAKAGHNAESHNHNDVGQFILFANGQPVIVDVGVETYTRKTFSPQRYEIWCIRGRAHNPPVVNGHEQQPGRSFAASGVACSQEGNTSTLSMDLAGAYAPEAGIKTLQRTIRLDRQSAAAQITDRYELAQGPTHLAITLFSPQACQLDQPGRIRIGEGAGAVTMSYDPAAVSAKISDMTIDDPNLQNNWGPWLARIELTYQSQAAQGRYELNFHLAE